MNTAKNDMLAKKNKCKPEQVTCLNCYYKWGDKNFCNYHKCGLLNFDEPCYKFKFCLK